MKNYMTSTLLRVRVSEPTLFYDDRRKQLEVELPRPLPHWNAAAKEIGAKWDNLINRWIVPAYRMHYQSIIDNFPGIVIDPVAEQWFVTVGSGHFALLDNVPAPPHEFYDFQREAVDFLTSNPHPGAILALSPGLGKSAVSLVSSLAREYKNVLVISPLSLLRNWEVEAERWIQADLVRCHGSGPVGNMVVTNYDTIAGTNLSLYLKQSWDLIIVDESILVKNAKTARYRAIKMLRGRAKRIWLLSGYPISKYADDLWAQLHLIDSRAFSSYWRFAERYCHIEQTVWAKKVVATRQDRSVRDDLKDIVFVRNANDVLDLPEYITQTIELEMRPDQRKAFTTLNDDLIAEIENGEEYSVNSTLTQLMAMQQVTSNLISIGGEDSSIKSDAIVELVQDNAVEFPLLIWTHWQPTGRALYNRLTKTGRKVGLVTGQNTADHEDIFTMFKAGELDILVCSMQIGKYGHTLTKTRTIIYHDITWDADAYMQSRDRVKRIGLEKAARLITLKVVNSTDQMVEDNLMGKMPGIAEISGSNLANLLKALR